MTSQNEIFSYDLNWVFYFILFIPNLAIIFSGWILFGLATDIIFTTFF